MHFLNLIIIGLYYFGKRNIWNALVIFVLVGITGLAFLQSTLANGGVDGAWWSGMWQNFATEMIGAIMTFALFEILINANNRQETLVRQMASQDHVTAMNAVVELRALGYLFDGTLHNRSLRHANLADVDLSEASLMKVDFQQANLRGVNFSGADLRGANLCDADLTGVTLQGVTVDKRTILPDSQHWSSNSDWEQFTVSATIPEQAPQKIKRPQSHHYRQLRAKRRL